MSEAFRNEISYNFIDGNSAMMNDNFLSACSKLYSENYGVWSNVSKNAGKNVFLSKSRIKDWLKGNNVAVYFASTNNDLVGYAVALSIDEPEYGIVTWITQLVVHKNYRNQGIAKNILLSIWGFSDRKAWGIVSANPYAVRALEKITRRRAIPNRIFKDIAKIKNIGIKNVCFIDSDTQFSVDKTQSKINTHFYVDHEDIEQKIANVTNDKVEWILGKIEEGEEWCAFTFQDQIQMPLSNEEMQNLLNTSDSIVKEAYSRMNLSSTKQKWMQNEESEIQYLKTQIDFSHVHFAYDLGCGIGRHSFILAKNNITTVGIDYVETNISKSNETKKRLSVENVSFDCFDCRTFKSNQKADLVLCLYDVVGTFATKEENLKIIQTAYGLLNKDGYAVFSVMNYELTEFIAKYKFKFSQNANELLKLKPSNTMEHSGNIFLPEYFMIDEEAHVVYRKEQFSSFGKIPKELIVRDMRFTKDEIISMCNSVGFTIVSAKYVNATDWTKDYSATDSKAKEILLICKK